MRYEQIDRKMPRELRELIIEQKWCSSFLEQGVTFPDLLTDRKYLAELNRHLSSDEKHTLRLMLSAFGCEPFTRDALEKQAALRMAGAQVALGLVDLEEQALLRLFAKHGGSSFLSCLRMLLQRGSCCYFRLISFKQVKRIWLLSCGKPGTLGNSTHQMQRDHRLIPEDWRSNCFIFWWLATNSHLYLSRIKGLYIKSSWKSLRNI